MACRATGRESGGHPLAAKQTLTKTVLRQPTRLHKPHCLCSSRCDQHSTSCQANQPAAHKHVCRKGSTAKVVQAMRMLPSLKYYHAPLQQAACCQLATGPWLECCGASSMPPLTPLLCLVCAAAGTSSVLTIAASTDNSMRTISGSCCGAAGTTC